jgi:hypothetical protein
MARKYVLTRSSLTAPKAEDIDLKGGYQTSPSTVDRDVIPAAYRKVGMLVYTVATDQTWILGPGITNGDWSLVTIGGVVESRRVVTGPTTATILDTDHVIFVNTSGGAVTLTLPVHTGSSRIFQVKDVGGTFNTNNCTLARNGGTGTIEGIAASYVLNTAYQKVSLVSDTTSAWWFL